MAIDDNKLWGEVSRAQRGIAVDGSTVPLRVSRRGELYTQGVNRHAFADAGEYFVLTNATPGTGIAGHAAPGGTVDDTKPLLYLRNDSAVGDGKRIYLDYLRLQVTAAGANGTDVRFAVKADTGSARRSSAGTAITPVNPNMASTTSGASDMTCYFGPVVAAAATTSARLITQRLHRNVIAVVGDTYFFDFGLERLAPASLAVAGTAITNIVHNCPPVVLGPQDQFLLHHMATSQTAASSFEFELGLWIR